MSLPNSINAPQRGLKLLALKKIGGATPTLFGLCARFCSITKNGTGDYTILVSTNQPFPHKIIVVATPHSSGIVRQDYSSPSNLQVRIKCFAVDGTTAADLDFDMIAVGTTSSDLQG